MYNGFTFKLSPVFCVYCSSFTYYSYIVVVVCQTTLINNLMMMMMMMMLFVTGLRNRGSKGYVYTKQKDH